MLAGTTTFDPILLPDSTVKSASVSDTTTPITVISSNVLGDLIDITGISGGLYVTVQGAMTSTYTTTAVTIGDDGAITSATGAAAIAAPERRLRPDARGRRERDRQRALRAVARIRRELRRQDPRHPASSTGRSRAISMPLSAIDRPISLTGSGAQIGLPHIDVLPQQLGFANGASQQLQLHNGGAAPLMIEVASAPSGVTAEAVTIAPGADGVDSSHRGRPELGR